MARDLLPDFRRGLGLLGKHLGHAADDVERVARLVRQAGGGEVHFLEVRIQFAGADEPNLKIGGGGDAAPGQARTNHRYCRQEGNDGPEPDIMFKRRAEGLRGHDDDKTVYALFLTEDLIVFLTHPTGPAEPGPATAVTKPHPVRIIVRRWWFSGIACSSGRGVGRIVQPGFGTRPGRRHAHAIGRIAVGKILPGQDDRQIGALDVVGEIGAEVHRIDEGDGLRIPFFRRAHGAPDLKLNPRPGGRNHLAGGVQQRDAVQFSSILLEQFRQRGFESFLGNHAAKAPLRAEHNAQCGGNVLGPVDQRCAGLFPDPHMLGHLPGNHQQPDPQQKAVNQGTAAFQFHKLLFAIQTVANQNCVLLFLFHRQPVQILVEHLFGYRIGDERRTVEFLSAEGRQLGGRLDDVRSQENEQFLLGGTFGTGFEQHSEDRNIAEEAEFCCRSMLWCRQSNHQ